MRHQPREPLSPALAPEYGEEGGDRLVSLDLDYPSTTDAAPAAVLPLQDEAYRAGRSLAWRMVPGYVALLIVGVLVFRFGHAVERAYELSVSRCVFTAVNAGTMTGFQQDIRISEQTLAGPAMLFALTLGGTLFSLIVGGLAATRILQLPYADRQIVVGAFTATIVAMLVGTIGLLERDRSLPQSIFRSLFLSLSAFGNSGLYLGRLGSISDVHVHAMLLPLSLVGGLGITVLLELFDRISGVRSLSVHARTVLTLTALLYLGFFGLFFLLQVTAGGPGAPGWHQSLLSSSAAAINARGGGFPVEYVSAFPRTMPWVLILLMMIGGNPAGTAGGLKATTVVELVAGVRAALSGRRVRRAFGVAAAWAMVYLGIVLFGFLLLVWQAPDLTGDRSLFLAVSAASNVGLSHDPIAITGPGLYVLSAVMLAGRIAPLLILWWMVRAAPDAEIAVG
jgi:trk system potassium uptake protein TrkH